MAHSTANNFQADDTNKAPIIFFDGVCNLCHRSVRWVIRHDRERIFRFASLQSQAARDLLSGRFKDGLPDGVVLVSGSGLWIKSDAWIQIFKLMGAHWSWIGITGILPRSFRDWAYDLIAARRYRWFGKLDTCPLPDPTLKNRFLD